MAGLVSLGLRPPTQADMSRHDALLKYWFNQQQVDGAVLVAHSQGNLFVNAAFDHFKPTSVDQKLKVVHVAPAANTTRGDWVLANIDKVILNLTKAGGIVPAVNLTMPESPLDSTGHEFQATYLDVTREGYGRVKGLINAALDAVF